VVRPQGDGEGGRGAVDFGSARSGGPPRPLAHGGGARGSGAVVGGGAGRGGSPPPLTQGGGARGGGAVVGGSAVREGRPPPLTQSGGARGGGAVVGGNDGRGGPLPSLTQESGARGGGVVVVGGAGRGGRLPPRTQGGGAGGSGASVGGGVGRGGPPPTLAKGGGERSGEAARRGSIGRSGMALALEDPRSRPPDRAGPRAGGSGGLPAALDSDASRIGDAQARRREGDADVGAALGRPRRRAVGDSDARGADPTGPVHGTYANLGYPHLVGRPEPVTEASFDCRTRDCAASTAAIHPCSPFQELLHDGRVAAHAVIDVNCTLVPANSLPSRFVAVKVRSLGADADKVPCWAWGDGALAETMLNVVSLHTLVWQARMTGYVLFVLLVCSVLRLLDIYWIEPLLTFQ